jgi:arsenate reductase-like glutaredoxin family protein
MRNSNFPVDQAEIESFLNDLNTLKAVIHTQSTPKEQLKLKKHGMSEDQLIEAQELLLASAQDNAIISKDEESLEQDSEEYD